MVYDIIPLGPFRCDNKLDYCQLLLEILYCHGGFKPKQMLQSFNMVHFHIALSWSAINCKVGILFPTAQLLDNFQDPLIFMVMAIWCLSK